MTDIKTLRERIYAVDAERQRWEKAVSGFSCNQGGAWFKLKGIIPEMIELIHAQDALLVDAKKALKRCAASPWMDTADIAWKALIKLEGISND